MTIHNKSCTEADKSRIDEIEQDLRSQGFIEVSPFVKLKPRQYALSRGTVNPKSFEGPVAYTISWCNDE